MKMKLKSTIATIIFLMIASLFFSCSTEEFAEKIPSVERSQFMEHDENWRNLRYGEVIPVWKKGLTLYMEVYNTVESNELPQDLWEKLDAVEMEREYGAEKVILNGPRYWVINEMDGRGETADGKVADFGGIEMTLRAVLENSIFSGAVGSSSYKEKTVQRFTTFTYWKDNMVYELTNDKGEVYRMQSYSQIYEPELTIDDLEFLAERLDLPDGWSYSARLLEEISRLSADGSATIITDELGNTYQKIRDGE